MGDVLVHFIHRAQVGLDFDKVVRILLKGDKDQASIKLPCLFIDAIRNRNMICVKSVDRLLWPNGHVNLLVV